MTAPTQRSGSADTVSLGDPRGKWVLFATVTGSTVVFLTSTIVNVALPAIGTDLGAGVAGRQWVVTGYLLTLSALILLGGSLGDQLGRRRVYVAGLLWFTVASLLCAVAPTMPLLVAARVLQGVGGALLTPGSLAIIQATFVPGDRARAIGAWSALLSIGQLVGPPLGGFVVDAFDWRWVFVVPVPLAAAAAVAAVRYVPDSRDPDATGTVDIAGGVTSMAALAGVTYAVIEAPEAGWSNPLVAAALIMGVMAAATFVVIERRVAEPMVPLGIFASQQFTWANVLSFVVYAALGGVSFLLVQHLIIVLGYSGTEAGLAFMPVAVLMLLLSERSGAIAQRVGPRWPLTVGSATIGVAMLLMAAIDAGDSYLTSVFPAAIVFGLGLAAIVAPVTATALAAAEERHSGVASGINNAVSRVAQLLAVAALPVAAGLTSREADIPPEVFSGGFQRAMLITAGLAGAGAVIAALRIRDDVLADQAQAGDAPRESIAADTPDAEAAVVGATARAARRAANDWHCGLEAAPLRPCPDEE